MLSADGERAVVLGMDTPLVVDTVTGPIIARLALTPLSDSVQTARLDSAGHRVVTQVTQRP